MFGHSTPLSETGESPHVRAAGRAAGSRRVQRGIIAREKVRRVRDSVPWANPPNKMSVGPPQNDGSEGPLHPALYGSCARRASKWSEWDNASRCQPAATRASFPCGRKMDGRKMKCLAIFLPIIWISLNRLPAQYQHESPASERRQPTPPYYKPLASGDPMDRPPRRRRAACSGQARSLTIRNRRSERALRG